MSGQQHQAVLALLLTAVTRLLSARVMLSMNVAAFMCWIRKGSMKGGPMLQDTAPVLLAGGGPHPLGARCLRGRLGTRVQGEPHACTEWN